MSLSRYPLRTSVGALAAILALTVLSAAQVSEPGASPKIKNFGQMDERFYRGAQPKMDDYRDLAALGIKTVIDLREDPTSYEKPAVEALGMRYVNIPMVAKKYPRQEQIDQFLRLVDDPATGKFFVHCAGGRHRTGVMGAVYRFRYYHWNFDQVYQEMKDYDFYTRWGHGAFKEFVRDYWQHMQASGISTSAGESSSQSSQQHD
ncbi:MAG TPA: tyrosine-protein phosphatase [Pyrinomonadaceae bacterium]|nr:tyrosine-protein phosphatase [Pyrinomonadaceae bacterium]